MQEIHDFRGFLSISQRVFGSKVLPSSCDKIKSFDYGCFSYPGDEAKSPVFGRFLRFWVFFGLSVLSKVFSLGH